MTGTIIGSIGIIPWAKILKMKDITCNEEIKSWPKILKMEDIEFTEEIESWPKTLKMKDIKCSEEIKSLPKTGQNSRASKGFSTNQVCTSQVPKVHCDIEDSPS